MPYKDKNKDKERKKEYYIKNKEEILKKNKLYYEKTKVLKNKEKETQICLICSKEFYPKGRWHKRPRKYCCRECYDVATSQRMLSNEFKVGKAPWNKGLKTGSLSEEHKDKIRQKTLLNGNKPPTYYGEDHPNWVNGKYKPPTKKIRYTEDAAWRKKVFKRDDYTCQKCGQRGGDLNAHHIFNYSSYIELRVEMENGITLCKNCHDCFHKQFGKKDNNDLQLKEFLTDPQLVIVEVK